MNPLQSNPIPRFDLAGMTARNIARGAAAASAGAQPPTALALPPALTDAWSMRRTEPATPPDPGAAQGGLGVLQKLMDQLDALLGQLLAGISAPGAGDGSGEGTAPPAPAREPRKTFSA